jgi:hypothetical protein
MPRSDNRISLLGAVRARWRQAPAGRTRRLWLLAIAALWLLLAPPAVGARSAARDARRAAPHHHATGVGRHRHRASGNHPANVTVLLGDARVEPLRYALAPGRSEAFRLRARTAGRLGALQLYVGDASTARSVLVGLYSDAHGRPGALLANGSASTAGSAGWRTVPLLPASRVTAGGHYWLTLLAEGGTLDYRARRHGRCPRAVSLRTNLSALPATASAARIRRHAHCPISAYATAASASAPGAPVLLSAPAIVASPPGTNPLSPGAPLTPAAPLTTPSPQETAEKEREREEAPHEEPAPIAPANSNLPTVGGSLVEGDVLTSTRGTWSGNPTSYAYRWQDCNASGANCASIAGATKTSYTLAAADVGHTIRVVVTAANEGGSTPASSAASAIVTAASPPPPPPPPPAPTNTKAPALSGTTTQGQALTATQGSWTGSPSSYAYQWQDCNASGSGCANIAGAGASSYTLAESDVGHTIRVVVTATNEGGSTPASSAASAIVAAYSGSSGYPECTQTIGTGANVASTFASASAGAVICLSSGSYGALSLNATHSGDVTVQAAPGAHVTAGTVAISGSHAVVRGIWIDGEVKLEEGTSFVTIDRDDISNEGNGGEGIVFDTSDCTVPNAPTWSGCEPHAPISDVTISHNHFHDIGQGGSEDAIHLDNWRNVTVTGNEFDHVIESGSHTDCLQSVYGGSGLVFDHNYEHDNDCQGIFVKDGDATNVSVTDNLFLRDSEGTYADFAQLWNIKNLTFQHNTIWDGKGMALVANGASFTPTATIDHNVISNFSLNSEGGPAYAITEGQDIFGEAPNRMSEGPGDSVNANPQFKSTGSDDCRLASNPNGIGVDWVPAEQQYGPAS